MSIINNGLLLASGADAATTYQISRSIRLNYDDQAYFSRTPSSAGNRRTWTWSAWVKRSKLGYYTRLFNQNSSGNCAIQFQEDDTLRLFDEFLPFNVVSTQVFRDPSAWYHIVVNLDTTQTTASNRVSLYVNGTKITSLSTANYPAQNAQAAINLAVAHGIGNGPPGEHFGGYLADIYFLDGTATDPSTFAQTDAVTGQWVPKTPTGISYGTNGFRLPFSDNSGTTSTTLGKDAAGSNNWTPNNFSVASGSGNDSLVDSPTSYGTDTGAGGEVRGNYCTLNPLAKTVTLSNGNLDATGANSGTARTGSTIAVSSGKWYWEVTFSPFGSINDLMVGIMPPNNSLTGSSDCIGFRSDEYGYYAVNGNKYNNGSSTSYGASFLTSGDVIGVALNLDAGTLTFYKNGTSQGQAYSGISGTFMPAISGGGTASANATCNFGQRAFAYTAPSGFKALCDTNLTSPTIAKPNTVMDVVLYTGNGSNRSISSLGFSPDFVWLKRRNLAASHNLFDIVRGATKFLGSDGTNAEQTGADRLTSFDSTGFSLGTNAEVNNNSDTYVAWTWDAGTSTVTNNNGTISSQVRANASAGFSIVTYTGTGSAATVGHGLGAAPSLIITKSRNNAYNWTVYHSSLGINQYLWLDSDAAASGSSGYWNTAPTSTIFGVGNNNTGSSGSNIVAYCFAPVTGYSSFGSYTGNGSSDGPFVYTGHRSRWLMVKASSSAGNWVIFDTARNTYNVVGNLLLADVSDSEYSVANLVDICSNGFKMRDTHSTRNASGVTYVYASFAESPFQYARAR